MIKKCEKDAQIKKHLKKYIKEIVEEYEKSRDILVNKRKTKRVFRGRQRIISSVSEDLFAKRICKLFPQKSICVFVDQPITFSHNAKKSTIYPDIIICKQEKKEENKYKILYMIDLKQDIGWHRNSKLKLYKELKEKCEKIKHTKSVKGNVFKDDTNDKQSIRFTIDNSASYDEVLISSRNSGKQEEEIKKLSNDVNKNFWCLTNSKHPNSKKKEGKIELNFEDWLLLIHKIDKIVNKNCK